MKCNVKAKIQFNKFERFINWVFETNIGLSLWFSLLIFLCGYLVIFIAVTEQF